MSASNGPRPVRNLAAWNWSDYDDPDVIEVDVWTVNERERDDDDEDPFARAREAFDGRVDSVDAVAGDIAKVTYAGAAPTGYRRISTDETVIQQAFGGAAREAGGSRTEAGTFGEGAEPVAVGPSHDEVVRHGREEVLPRVKAALAELGRAVTFSRNENRDEVEELTQAPPFDGFDSTVRITSKGTVYEYDLEELEGS